MAADKDELHDVRLSLSKPASRNNVCPESLSDPPWYRTQFVLDITVSDPSII